MENGISIKGTRDGVAIALGQGELESLANELSRHLDQRGAFFRGGVVTLSVDDRCMASADIQRFQQLLDRHEMALRSVSGSHPDTLAAARELGLHVSDAAGDTTGKAADDEAPPAMPPEVVAETEAEPQQENETEAIARAGARGLIVRRRLRAGQSVRHSGSVVIIGDVNAGAEIVAGGDIVVWGRLKGTAHAGCFGNASAVVCALDLAPLQLRIADLITRPEDGGPGRDESYPEVAYVRDRIIFVERWTAIRWRD